MKTFKFGQLLTKNDICNREREIQLLTKVCQVRGRALVYGPRRFGKTSIVKNVVMANFLEESQRSLAIYADFFQVDSVGETVSRLQVAFEQALNQRATIQSFLKGIKNYLEHFRIEMSLDPLSGAPTIVLTGHHARDEKTLAELFLSIKNLSADYKTLLVLDEFQDIHSCVGLEAKLRSEIQSLDQTAVILLGSKRHILTEMFHDESRPFYGFGTDVELKAIPRTEWVPYLRERFAPVKITIEEEGVFEICSLMRDVPNAIQEFCQWIVLSDQTGLLTIQRIHENLIHLIENKSSRYLEKLSSLSLKEKKVLIALAKQEPVATISSSKFLRATEVSATATKAIILRLTDQGILDASEEGYSVTDPIFKVFLVRQSGTA